MVATGCGGDSPVGPTVATTTAATTTTAAPATTVTTTTVAATTTTSTTTTTAPEQTSENRTLATEGDENEIVEAVQFLINCSGFDDLVVDGDFGPATKAGVRKSQEGVGIAVDGEVDDELLWHLSRRCSSQRRITGAGEVTVVGNTDPADAEVYVLPLLAGSTIGVTIAEGDEIELRLTAEDATEIAPQEDGTWLVEASEDFRLTVTAVGELPTTFVLTIDLGAGSEGTAWVLATNGISYGDTKLSFGDDVATVLDKVEDFLGHGIRGGYAEFDTGWTEEPGNIGIRGVFIENLAFLFYGPSTDYPGYAEQLARIRYEGPGFDANGDPRPSNYVATALGVTVGHDLGYLKEIYGSQVKSGDNGSEYYYRYTDSGGELCFYFGGSSPSNSSEILEIATECRE